MWEILHWQQLYNNEHALVNCIFITCLNCPKSLQKLYGNNTETVEVLWNTNEQMTFNETQVWGADLDNWALNNFCKPFTKITE